MLQAKTKEQMSHVDALLKGVAIVDDSSVTIASGTITFDEMAEIVDFLRSNKPKKCALDMSIISEPMREAVETWLAYKKEKGQSYKPTGFKTFYKKLCEMSHNDPQLAMQIVEFSMQNNYAGIFPPRNNNNNTNNYGRETITEKIRRTVENANAFSQRIKERIGQPSELDFGDNESVW